MASAGVQWARVRSEVRERAQAELPAGAQAGGRVQPGEAVQQGAQGEVSPGRQQHYQL